MEENHLLGLLFCLDHMRRRVAEVKRRAESGKGREAVGFFATRTPRRPNPSGVACPRLLAPHGNRLVVSGIDAWDGTPILDLKGYYPRDGLPMDAIVRTWPREVRAKHGANW